MSVVLNLRVSGDKRKPSTKQFNGKEESIGHIIRKLRKTPCNGFAKHLDDLQLATSIDKQLTILKEITNKYIKNPDEATDKELLDFCIYVLVDIYLSVKLKSPLKSGIVRILNSLTEEAKEVVHKQCCESICDRLNQENIDLKTYNDYSNTLILCFESFPNGSASVIACEEVVIRFIDNALKLCRELLSTELAPTYKLEICQCVHSMIRIAVCLVQKTTSSNLEVLKSHALSFLSMEDLPLDTRTNCGLLAVLCSKQDWIQLLTEFYAASSDIIKLCLYSGILNAVPYTHLEQAISFGSVDSLKPVLQVLFNSLMEIQNRNPTNCIIVLSISRIMLLLIRSLHQNPAGILPLLSQLLDYTWIHLDHYMDSVRHLVNSLLESLVKLHAPGVDVLSPIQERMQETPMWSRAKHAALAVLIGRVPVGEILTLSPDMIPNLLDHLQHPVVASHIVNTYENLMQQHFIEEPNQEKWTKLWIQPVILALDHCTNVALQQVLAKAVKTSSQIITEIIHIENINISTILSCLLVSRKLGLLDKYQKENCKWKGLITYQTLSEAFLHHSDKVRLSCLALLVESHKTTEVFSIAELQLVKQYLTSNLSFQAAASRQQSQVLLNKFLVRLKDSSQTLQKDISQAELKEVPTGYLKEVVDEYSIFCEWLVKFCIDNLFPGANYSRRTTVLQILTSCNQLELWPDSKKTPQEGDVLLACLADSYEDNKTLAAQLLADISTLVPAFQDPQQVVFILKECISLGASIRPPDSTTAAYLLSTLVAFPFSKITFQQISDEYEECCLLLNDEKMNQEVFCCLLIILKHLSDQLKIAERSLLRAAASGPLYGLLFMVRHLLEQVCLKDLKSNNWNSLIRQIITLCFSCSQAVASIVNSSSPEGHLPMDFDFDTSKLETGLDEEDSINPGEVSSQMVLLCSWRTVKEVSLLLGYIAEQASVGSDTEVGLLEKEDLLKIGDHLTTMLAETKHRGAFEQAYVGFCKLASRLWRFPSGDLHGLPNKWLQETMQEINNGGKLCATRRSAGIPFMIQALICTELEVKGRSSLNIWMNQLLDMAENKVLSPETHTHALNIMRALFRNTQLGETVSPFVERAIIITVIGFSASTWPERNSATLLLSTLVSRVFGVPRSKSHILSWKNKMTGRIFFQRYPKLFDFFRDQLEKATKSCNETSLQPSLYPVLLFLGRLYPSSLEGTDSNLQLSNYIPYIEACAGSRVLKTRTLAAAAMVPLISPDKLPHCLNNLFCNLMQNGLKTNEKHGILLQACFLLEYTSELPETITTEMQRYCQQWILKLLLVLENKQCPIVTETLFHVMIVLSTKYNKLVPSDIWNSMSDKLENLLFNSRSNGLGCSLCQKKCAELFLKIIVLFKNTEDIIIVIGRLLNHDDYEVVYTVLDFICVLLSQSSDEQSVINYLECSSNQMLKSEVLKNQSIAESILIKMCSRPIHTSDMEKVLSVVKVYPLLLRLVSKEFGVQSFIELCKDEDEIRVVDVLECIRAILNEEVLCSNKDIIDITNLLVEYSKPEYSEDCHQAVARLLLKHFHRLTNKTLPLDYRLRVYTILMQLQCDDPTTWQTLMETLVNSEDDLYCKATVLLALALGDLSNEASVLDLTKGQVFDKGEVSSFHEEAMLSQQAGKHFKNLLHSVDEQFLLTPLPPSLIQFLDHHCRIRADNLANFLSSVVEHSKKQNYNDICGFLKSGYQAAKLKSLKLKYIL